MSSGAEPYICAIKMKARARVEERQTPVTAACPQDWKVRVDDTGH